MSFDEHLSKPVIKITQVCVCVCVCVCLRVGLHLYLFVRFLRHYIPFMSSEFAPSLKTPFPRFATNRNSDIAKVLTS